MIRKEAINQRFYKNFFIISVILAFAIAAASLCIIYYWSFYHYNHIFEDRIIDEENLKYAAEMGIKNEWLLGVSTDSIDVLEATYNEETRDHIYQQALNQQEIEKFYREKIDNKELIYCISLTPKNGEFFYKYSVIRDLYHEVFPYIVGSLAAFVILLVFILYFYFRFIERQFSSELAKLQAYAHKLENLALNTEPVKPCNNNNLIDALENSFYEMHIKLLKKEQLQKSSLQYISHEMKSPIMIIESYAVSAKEKIYPIGTLDDSLNIILEQTTRMEEKVSSLLEYVTLSTKEIQKEIFSLSDMFDTIFADYHTQIHMVKYVHFHIHPYLNIFADRHKIRVVLENILENQLKYKDSQIAIRAYQNQKDQIIILFYNDGASIGPELKNQIFTPFAKGYNGSNGLGLSITKTILLQHQGDIELLSTRKGTLFRITIPMSISSCCSIDSGKS